MPGYSLSHLADHDLLRELHSLVAREREATAEVLAHIAEVDARQLYLPAAYHSMHAYCLGELHFSEDAAYKRIQIARKARRFPAIFTAVADGRLHLTGLGLLVPHMIPRNVDELLAAASHKSKAEIERLLAERFPRADLPESVRAVPPSPGTTLQPPQLAPAQVGASMESTEPASPGLSGDATQAGRRPQLAPAQVGASSPSRVAPLSATRYGFQFTVDERVHVKFRHVQALLAHRQGAGSIVEIFELMLDLTIRDLERQKFASTDRPRRPRRGKSARHIPAAVKRAVCERDGGRCTFVSKAGRRCEARSRLEYDHVEPVARGGTATVAGIRLRCRAHNQFAAEQVFGTAFMQGKREQARRRAVETRNAQGHRGVLTAGLLARASGW